MVRAPPWTVTLGSWSPFGADLSLGAAPHQCLSGAPLPLTGTLGGVTCFVGLVWTFFSHVFTRLPVTPGNKHFHGALIPGLIYTTHPETWPRSLGVHVALRRQERVA